MAHLIHYGKSQAGSLKILCPADIGQKSFFTNDKKSVTCNACQSLIDKSEFISRPSRIIIDV